ncbi:dfp2-like protein 6 [Dermatophagoides farinae]|uniref:Dfp2-like protein 6 n=2 Tax=Dermatophagoides farinae TaxID=6954 RepID=A0A9D4SG88_DERFA|nr:dfp2-like protein 6 [Dermatophagoides farinae]
MFVLASLASVVKSYNSGRTYSSEVETDHHDNDYGKEEPGIEAAFTSKHAIETYSVPTSAEHKTPVVDINSVPLSLKIRFNSHSSNIVAVQNHFGSHGQVKKSNSIDQPDILIHNIKKPIIQEIRESITPYRKRIQEVKPVHEKIETVIATRHRSGYGHGYAGGGGGGRGRGSHYDD